MIISDVSQNADVKSAAEEPSVSIQEPDQVASDSVEEAAERIGNDRPDLDETVSANQEIVTPETGSQSEETAAVTEEETRHANENFETKLEDDPSQVPSGMTSSSEMNNDNSKCLGIVLPLESFTMRAEREAVQEAVDQVWVMTVRCIEELRGLQVTAKASPTHDAIENISQRLEPLRNRLDELVKTTSENLFDGALEQAADLERQLRAVLDEIEEARSQDVCYYSVAS